MKITVEISDADQTALGGTPFRAAASVHELVRRDSRRLGGPGATAVEYLAEDWRTMREEADPSGLIKGPYPVPSPTRRTP